MFEWKVEETALLNESKGGTFAGREYIYNCELRTSREDKIKFVDKMQDGKLSYILSLIEKFKADRDSLPKDKWGSVKTVSLKAWINRNDTKYGKPIVDTMYNHGKYYILGMGRWIHSDYKGTYDTHYDLVDEVFHRQLKECRKKEHEYFLEHDEYSILKEKFRNKDYDTTFGVHIATSSDGNIYVCEGKDSFYDGNRRKITIDELKYLLSRYEELDKLVAKITEETNIVY